MWPPKVSTMPDVYIYNIYLCHMYAQCSTHIHKDLRIYIYRYTCNKQIILLVIIIILIILINYYHYHYHY